MNLTRIAMYVEALETCMVETTRAEDRPIYLNLLADSAGLLATAAIGNDEVRLNSRIGVHERLRGQVWLTDPIEDKASRAWQYVVAGQ